MSPPPSTIPDAAAVRAAIERATELLAKNGRPDLAPLERELRTHAEALLPAAEAAVAQLWKGSLEWWQRDDRLRILRNLLAQPCASYPLTAHIQVRHLVTDCTALLDYIEDGAER